MGAAPSSGFAASQADQAARAQLAKDLPHKILTLMFSTADFKDLLTLSNIDNCPSYIFTSAQSLESLFTKVKVRPERGKSGEFLYAPVKSMSPELFKNSSPSYEETAVRDTMCVDIAYYYVRIFQIYAAIALTIMNTNPMRGAVVSRQGMVAQAQGIATTGPRSGVFSGGGRIPEPTAKAISTSLFAPVLNSQYFSPWASDPSPTSNRAMLKLNDTSRTAQFIVVWDKSRVSQPKMDLQAVYIYGRATNGEKKEECVISMSEAGDDDIALGINGDLIANFKKDALGAWSLYTREQSYGTSSPTELYKLIHEYFKDKTGSSSYNAGWTASGPSGPSAPSGPSVAYGPRRALTGKSSFENFEAMEKMYSSLLKGEISAPKAFAVGRAMTLMNPIFDTELSYKDQPVTCGSCMVQSRLDFETSADYMMPRAGKDPKTNIYFRSLVSLYYDTYRIERDGQKRRLVFEKSNPGSEDLKRASVLMAKLYNIPVAPTEFLESSSKFLPFKKLCGESNKDVYVQYGDPAIKSAIRTIIAKMLAFQEEHNKRANAFLKTMFSVIINPKQGESLMFSKDLKDGGINAVNVYCKNARDMLLEYYLKSEAMYVEAILLLEANRDKLIVGGDKLRL